MESSSGNSIGRPCLFDAEKRGQVLALLRSGCSKRRAAAYVGIDESTIRRAEKVDLEFAMEVAKASTQFEVDLVNKMRSQAEKSWRAAAWLLERRLPDEFGTPPKREREKVVQTQEDLLREFREGLIG
jgi:hypothetical protein